MIYYCIIFVFCFSLLHLFIKVTPRLKDITFVHALLDIYVNLAVKEMEQVKVKNLKKENPLVDLNDDEALEIRNIAIENVEDYLGPKRVKNFKKVLQLKGKFWKSFLSAKIDACVYDLRRSE